MAKIELFSELSVQLSSHVYPIYIGRAILQDKTFLCRHLTTKKLMIVSNTTLAKLYLPDLLATLSDKHCDTVILNDGETYKNNHSLWQIYDALIQHGHHRDTTIVALGGGVVGDIAGFAASTWQRGVRFIQLPTSLLAQIDSSVGGKTAINHPDGKNMIGSFYQPDAVFIDMETLKTLPLREFRAGFAEMIKYAVLVGGSFLQQVHALLLAWAKLDDVEAFMQKPEGLAECIARCCQIKADVVQQDERETSVRALLNLGHTVGHALEASAQYSRWLHGEAVAIGLYAAALLSQQHCGLASDDVHKIDELLSLAGLPRRIPADVDLSQIRQLMNADKKIKHNKLRFVLIKAMGECYLDDNITDVELQTILQAAVEGE